MENYDLFGDELGSGMLDGLGDLGTNSNFNNSSNQSTGAGNMMQSYNNQQPQYTQIGQGMSHPSKMTPVGNYPDYSNQYGQYGGAGGSTQPPPGLGGYGGSTPTRPMAGYPYPHQPTASPSMHYQDYSVVQNPGAMIRPPAPTPQHAPPPRMVTPSSQQSQQQFAVGGYRPPPLSQESMYLQQFPRWNEQQTSSPYGTSSLPHHYPSSASSGYRAPAPPPHAYPSNLPRPPQPTPPQQQQQPPQQQQSSQPPPPSSAAAVNSQQQQQHNIPYMPRPQTPSVMPQPSQPQYGQSMYPNSNNQYPNYHHASPSVGQLPSTPTPSSSSYPHHTQQQYSLATPSPQHQYSNQYGQYYPTGTNASLSNPPQGPTPTGSMAYPGSYPPSLPPSINSSVPNGNPNYRPGYAQLPQLSPRQPVPSPRQQPVPSPKPPSSTTPTIPSSPAPPTMSQSQQQQPQGIPTANSQQPSQQQQQPSSLQQLEQMVMPHVNNKNSPSPKPPHNNTNMSASGGGGGVLSPMSMGGPKTPMSPGMQQGPKTPMSPTQWQPSGPRPPAPQIASKPSYLHAPQQQQLPNSPSSYGHGMPHSGSNVDSTINSVATRSGQESSSDLGFSGFSETLDTSAPDTSIPPSGGSNEEMKPTTPIPPVSHHHNLQNNNDINGVSSVNEGSKTHSENSLKENQSQISVHSEEQRFSGSTTTNKESPMEGEKSGALTSLSSAVDNSQHSAMYTSSSSREPNSMSNQNSQISSSPSTPMSSSNNNNNNSQSQQQQPDFASQYSTPNINGTAESCQNQASGQMMGNNMMGGYGSGPPPQSQPYGNSMGSPQSSMKPMMPPQNSHQYPPPQRFPTDPNGQPQPYMNNYHNSGMYPVSPYGQPMPVGPMRPTGPPQYPMSAMGPQGPERFAYEAHQINQQLQHLYSLPPNPQSQVQINDLQERLRNLESQSMSGGQYPMQPPMGGMPGPPYGIGGMPMGGMPMDMPMDLPENGPSKGKTKKERKPRGEPKEPKAKGKKGKGKNNLMDPALLQPPQLPDEIYEFQDVPLDMPEKKSKKQRKPREQKSPAKPKKGKEPKDQKEKTPKSRSRKKKPSDDADESMNSSFLGGEPMDADIGLPQIEDNSESDQKNGIGAAGITVAEGGPSAPISGVDGDTSTQDTVAPNDTEAIINSELATPEKAKPKPKKPKLKSNSTGKKRPSKTLLAFKNRKKRRRSDSEASEIERTPPPSPPPEEDSNKRRSGRNTQRKKYIDDIDLALSDEDLMLPNKALKKAIEASVASEAKLADETLPLEDQTETDAGATPVVATPTKTPTTKEKSKTVTEESPNLNKHNFFYVNTAEEDTMVVQHILTMRMGKREVIDSSDDEDEEEKKDVKPNATKETIEEKKSDDPENKEDAAKIEENSTIQKTDSCDTVEPVVTAEKEETTSELPPADSVVEKDVAEPEKSQSDSKVTTTTDSIKEEPQSAAESLETVNVEDSKVEKSDILDPSQQNEAAEIVVSTNETPNNPSGGKKKKENRTIEVEEFYVKYKNFSYLHCEWKTEEELMKGDKRVNGKIKRFKQKLANNANIFEFIEEDPFNPEYVEVDRVLDMSEVTDPSGKVTKNYLVKWRSLPYDEATWELEDDIDPEKLAQFHRFHLCPKKDQWKRKPRPKAAEWMKIDESPIYKNANYLREYQLEGLNWLSFSWFNGRNCILADEMGLGKTIQSLTFVESVHRYGIRGPFLVIAPLSTVPNWQREFETWTDLNVVVYHGSVASRNMIQEYELFYRHPDNPQMNLKDCYKFNVLITTFEIVLTDVMELKDFPWRVCVIDEAHRLKNKNCKLLEGLRLLNMEHRVLLSGTPLQNNVQELFSLLNFLEPSQFASDESFVKEFGDLKSETQVQKLQALLKPMMLRRLKEDVEKSIAPKEETIVEVELTNMQKKYYRAILERNFSFLSKGTTSSNIPNLMNTMMELRKCCIHPYLLNGAEEQIQLDYRLTHNLPESDPDVYYKALVQSSGKMVLVDKLLAKLKASGHRVLLFSQMVRCLDILEDYLIYRQYPYERLDGRIRGSVRQAAIDRYSKPDSDRFVFLLCTKAGGLGINLTAADTVIIYDSDWNPQNDLQAQARCHRIGQSKKVKIYRLICRNTYEREMFDRASLKLGLDRAVLQSMNTTQGGKIDPNASASKQLTKKEVEDLLKRGAYGALMDEDDGEKFCEEDIDVILERRTQVITLESGEKGSTFSKASFAATGNREDISVDDPDFWKKWAKRAEIDTEEGVDKNALVIDEPRRRTQIRRYGHDEGIMMETDIDSSSDSDEEGNVGDRTRSGKASGRRTRSGKGKRGRRGNLDDEYTIDDGVVEYGKWSKSECYKIERGLLTYGWKRWNKILEQGQFRLGWDEHHMENCARLILLHCVNNFRGDEKVKSFVADLICPLENANNITRNHSGLANPVSRGGRKSKKKDLLMKMELEPTNEDWMRDMRYDTESHLDPAFVKHLSKNANKVLLRIRMLYYIKQEIIGNVAEKIDREVPSSELNICPPSLIVDVGPVDWWDKEADSCLLAGTYKHGYERYNIMRQDPALCFLSRVGPPDGSAVLAEISSEVNEEDMDKDVGAEEEDEESNMEAKEISTEKEDNIKSKAADLETPDKEIEKSDAEPSSTIAEENPKPESTEPEKPIWPGTTDLNTRIRKLITAFQRYFKKEELKNAQKAKRMERKEKIDQIVRDRERQKMEIHQKRWSKKEEADFYRTISTFGVQRIEKNKFDWSKFRAISRLDKKFDETLTEYFRAFYAMCKRICGQKLSEEEEFDLIQVPVDPLPEDRARRTLDRLDLLNKIRTEIIHNDKLDERLKLCLPSLDMPEWWIPGKHDRDLLYGAARHGLGRTELFYVNDPDLSFREILRRHMAGEPLLDPAEKAAYKNAEQDKNADKKIKSESEPPPLKRMRSDMVDIEIQDLKGEIEREKRKNEAEAAANKEKKAAVEDKLDDISNSKEEGDVCKPVKSNEEDETKQPEDKEEGLVIKTEKPDFEEKAENLELKDDAVPEKEEQQEIPFVKQEPLDVPESFEEKEPESKEIVSIEQPPTTDVPAFEINKNAPAADEEAVLEKENLDAKPKSPAVVNEEKSPTAKEQAMECETVKEKSKEPEPMEVALPEEREKVTNEKDESQGSSMEMNEVQVEIKNQLKITIKLPAEKMNRVEVQVKGSPKFSMPELPPPTVAAPLPPTVAADKEESAPKATLPKFDPFMQTESSSMEALLNSTNPIRWPRDRAIQIRLEHIVHAVEKNEWPVSRFFSSAAMAETFEYTPQGTPETATPVRDTPTPISECSDLAPPEDLIMSLPSSNSTSSMVSSTTITPVPVPGRRGRRRKIAIDVETERAKLQALLSQTMHQSNLLSHLPNNPRLSSALRRERGDRNSSRGLNLSHDSDKELESRLNQMNIPSLGKSSKFQPPPPAHQHHSIAGAAASLLRNSHQQQQQQQQQQSHRRSRSPITRRGSPGFSTQAQSSTLDLSIKSTHKDVAAAAMSALSSLSSVTVTPVTLPSSSSKSSRDRNRESGIGSGGLTISSSPMDLSGGVSKRPRESASSMLEKAFAPQDAPLNFGPPKKVSKLENMLDKLKKQKLGDSPDPSEPLPLEKDKKRRKLDEIVFGLSATKGSNVFSPPLVPEKRSSGAANLSHLASSHQSQGGRNASSSPHVSSHSGARSGTPSPAMPSAAMAAKEAQAAFAQNFLNNPLFSALSMFNAKDLKDLKDFSRFAANAANLQQSKKDAQQRVSANSPSPGASQTPEIPKCDLSRLAEIAVPKFDLFSQDAKVNKWLAEHANMTPERPPSPEFVDRRRRRQPRSDPLMMDWNKLSGEENVPVIHRANGKKITGPKAPQLKNLAQWLLENQSYDVDPRWAELVKERGNLPSDLQKRLQGEKKKGPGRPPTVTSPAPPTPTSSANTTSVPTSSASNAFSNLGAFSNLPGLAGINPSLLASFGALDPKNPLFMPFGGLGSLGNLSSLGNLANLGSLSGMGNLGLPNNLFGLGSPFMNFGQDMPGMPSNAGDKGSSSKDTQQSSSNSRTNSSSQSKREEKSKKSSNASAAAQQQQQQQQNLLSSSLPFLFPNPGLMYNPLGLGSFPMGGGVSGSPFGNLGQGSMLNGLGGDGTSGNKKSSASGSKSSSASNANPLLAAGLAGLNIPSLSKKDMKELAAMTGHASLLKQHDRSGKEAMPKDMPSAAALAAMMSQPVHAEDSDDESLKSLMGNHQDDLPDDEVAPDNAERIVLKESKELEKEMAQQKMETRREKRLRDREDRGGLTSAERQLLMEKKKERLAKEEEPPRESSGRTTRRSAANRSRLEDTVTKLKDVSDEGEDSPEKC